MADPDLRNLDPQTVHGFGYEWTHYDQSGLGADELAAMFNDYFDIFPWTSLPLDARGMDVGCGSGRWAKLVAPRVGLLHCIDASADALAVARRNLAGVANVEFHHASVDDMPIADGSMDFGYSLGVLHHVPHTEAALSACTRKLRPGAPFLVYLYYAFDTRPDWYRALWRISDAMRRVLSRTPGPIRLAVSTVVAALVYWPLALWAAHRERAGRGLHNHPFAIYRNHSFYTMRTDALDRLGTRLERRFTKQEVAAMMERAGLERIRFSDRAPYWCAVGFRGA